MSCYLLLIKKPKRHVYSKGKLICRTKEGRFWRPRVSSSFLLKLARHTPTLFTIILVQGYDLSPSFHARQFIEFTVTLLTPPHAHQQPRTPISSNRPAVMHWSRVALLAIGQGLIHICFSLVVCCHPPVCCEFCFLFSFTCFTQLRLDLAGRGEVDSGSSLFEAGVLPLCFIVSRWKKRCHSFSWFINASRKYILTEWRRHVGG